VPISSVERFVLPEVHLIASLGGYMRKADTEVPELTEEELAFEMVEITCEEMDSLAKAFEMISDLCRELNGEDVEMDLPSEAELH